MTRWFRHYCGMARDEKLVRAALRAKQPVERVVWVFGAMLESAADINDGGRYELDAAEVAYFLRCPEDDVSAIVRALADLGRVKDGVIGQWADRQFESDTSKVRQQRYRDRQKAARGAQKRQRDVTPSSRDGGVTLQETETESKKEEEDKSPAPAPVAAGAQDLFHEVWRTFPRNPTSNEMRARRLFEDLEPAERQTAAAAASQFSRWFAADCEERKRSVRASLRFVQHLSTWIESGNWRQADALPVPGVDPALVVLTPEHPDFQAVEALRGRRVHVGKSGRATLERTEIERARARRDAVSSEERHVAVEAP